MRRCQVQDARQSRQFLGDRAPSTYGALAPCDKVIEAVFVTMALKKIFPRLGEVFKPGCVLSSNTDVLNMRISCQLSVRSRCMPLPTLDRTSTCQSSSTSLKRQDHVECRPQANLFGDVELVWHTKGVFDTEVSAMPRPLA